MHKKRVKPLGFLQIKLADNSFDELVEKLAQALPEWASVSIHIERGAAWTVMTDSDGNDVDIESCESFHKDLQNALSMCKVL